MGKKKLYYVSALCASLVAGGFIFSQKAEAVKSPEEAPVDPKNCYSCHGLIKDFHTKGAHKNVNCVNCHTGVGTHLKDVTKRPATVTDHEACGKCHKEQYESFLGHNYRKHAFYDKGDPKSRSPFWETLIRPYAFEIYHAEPRSHKYMLLDHLAADRAYGGRFQYKRGFQDVVIKGPVKAWDILYDAFPEEDPKGPKKFFVPRTWPAAVAMCLLCKTQDHILAWPYMGDPTPKSDINRTTNPAYIAKQYLNNGFNCFLCHDPHSAEPRIVRDALIEALTTRNDTLWHEGYPNKANFKVYGNKEGLGLRGFERKIAILDRYDPNLQCGQCHVEYNCGALHDYEKSEYGKPPVPVDFATDRRSNHFPFVTLAKIDPKSLKITEPTFMNHLAKYKFFDFVHWATGAKLWKAQHPEVETYYNSPHAMIGATCVDCHTDKGIAGFAKRSSGDKIAKSEKKFTSHFHASPRDFNWSPCLKCHTDWTPKDAEYAVESVKNYIRHHMRKAEIWLRELVQTFQRAKDWGVDAETLNKARKLHEEAHMYWEWWTAENSDGFHNPKLAKATLARSVQLSWEAIDLLNKAIAEKRAKMETAKK